MAYICKEILISASPDNVWAAIRDFGGIHDNAARGFVVDTKLEGDARIVTFANGPIARERLIDLDDTSRRISYAAVGGRLTHHNASMQVFAEGAEGSRVVWITDFLPNELTETIAAMLEQGSAALKRNLESAVRAGPSVA